MVAKGFDLVTILGDSRIMAAAAEALVKGVKADANPGEDNIAYVVAVVERLRDESPGSVEGALVLAGFSQGVAMAYRAAANLGAHCRGVIALVGRAS